MKHFIKVCLLIGTISLSACAAEKNQQDTTAMVKEVQWQAGNDVEKFWLQYAESKGGLTWGQSITYPDYEQVNEGDTLMILLDQGPCLMEFFHSRWRRANDVRRWDNSINEYGGCPYVFD